jgi:uncharacterized protein YndB with AHSA1/START domain
MNIVIQGANETVLRATPQQIWAVLEDSQLLPRWIPMVRAVTTMEEREHVGAMRTCQVEMEGRRGEIVERCIEATPHRKIAWMMERDSLGFSSMFTDFGFSFELEPMAGTATLVRLRGFYRPKHLLARVMNAFVMRRKLHRLRERILVNLRQIVEDRAVPLAQRARSVAP